MAAFIVAIVRITDRVAFMRYVEQLGNLSAQFGGEPIVRGSAVAVLDGEAEPGERVVVTHFSDADADADAIRGYFSSPAYQAARTHRIGAGEAIIRLVE